jgi:serine/threonine-protein kinase RsbW
MYPAKALTRCYPATPGSVHVARHELTAFARAAGASPEQVDAIRLAASEALTNAVLHAYDGEPGRVELTAAIAGEELWVLIADEGRGLRTAAGRAGLGLGLALIAHSADHFAVVKRASGGTEMQMRFALHPPRPARGHARGSLASAPTPA